MFIPSVYLAEIESFIKSNNQLKKYVENQQITPELGHVSDQKDFFEAMVKIGTFIRGENQHFFSNKNIETEENREEQLTKVKTFINALLTKNEFKIVNVLQENEGTVTIQRLRTATGLAKSTILHHLRILYYLRVLETIRVSHKTTKVVFTSFYYALRK